MFKCNSIKIPLNDTYTLTYIHNMVLYFHYMDFYMKHRENLKAVYFQLTPENRACLAACAQLCRSAENAVKKGFAREETQPTTAGGKQQGFEAER
jgi:hypothetical protein